MADALDFFCRRNTAMFTTFTVRVIIIIIHTRTHAHTHAHVRDSVGLLVTEQAFIIITIFQKNITLGFQIRFIQKN
jgi:hypothetical protein